MIKKLKTPEGKIAVESFDGVMMLFRWAKYLEKKSQEEKSENNSAIIFAGIGWPTLSVSEKLVENGLNYWRNLQKDYSAIGYSLPAGDLLAREIMASALTKDYGNVVQIKPDDIVFTVGGAAAIRVALEALNERYPDSKILTTLPYYTRYDHFKNLYPVNCLKAKGYRLTAELLRENILQAKNSEIQLGGFIFCDPNNPTGNGIKPDEFKKMLDVFRDDLPDVPIIIDEAYVEMTFNLDHVSLLRVVAENAPELLSRFVVMRSATKGFSAAGLRFAAAYVPDPAFRELMINSHTNFCGPSPVDHQFIYAKTMASLAGSPNERARMVNFYRPKVGFVVNRLKQIGAAMPDPDYFPDGAFYVMADLSDLYGMPFSESLRDKVFETDKKTITTDEEIAYSLLFEEGLMIEPLSYQGVKDDLGYFRITCSASQDILQEMMNRIERQLIFAREINFNKLKKELVELLPADISNKIFSLARRILDVKTEVSSHAGNLRKLNFGLEEILKIVKQNKQQEISEQKILNPLIEIYQRQIQVVWSDVQSVVKKNHPEYKAAVVIQAGFRGFFTQKRLIAKQQQVYELKKQELQSAEQARNQAEEDYQSELKRLKKLAPNFFRVELDENVERKIVRAYSSPGLNTKF